MPKNPSAPAKEPTSPETPVVETPVRSKKKDDRLEILIREKVVAGLPRKDSEEVAKRQIEEDDAREAESAKKIK